MRQLLSCIICISISFAAAAQNVAFADSAFLKAILQSKESIDANKDGFIQVKEAEIVSELNLYGQGLINIEDIHHFKNVKKINLTGNKLNRLELKGLLLLEELYCAKNELTVLIISDMPSLKYLACGRNNLKYVSLVNIPNLESLNLMDNKLKKIDLTPFIKLKYLTIDNNELKAIDIHKNLQLIQLDINGNNIKSIDITNHSVIKVENLYIDDGKTKLVGTPEQLKRYKPSPIITTY